MQGFWGCYVSVSRVLCNLIGQGSSQDDADVSNKLPPGSRAYARTCSLRGHAPRGIPTITFFAPKPMREYMCTYL